MNLSKFLKIRKIVENPAKINLRNILAVIQSYFRKWQTKPKTFLTSGISLPQDKWEQIIYRKHTLIVTKSPCWEAGYCLQCGCEFPDKLFEDRSCEKNCYPEMKTPEDWEKYKQEQQIKLFE